MSEAAWDSDGFEPPVLAKDDEELFVHPTTSAAEPPLTDYDDELDTLPVLVVNLAPLAEADDRLKGEYALVRQCVLTTLEQDWSEKSAELMANGMCWHAPRCSSAAFRESYEAAHPGSVLSVIEYPEHLDEVRPAALWQAVMRSTPWEVVDALKEHIGRSRRTLKFQADLCVELEELAETEQRHVDACADAKALLAGAVRRKERALGAMHDAHAPAAGGTAAAVDGPVDVADATSGGAPSSPAAVVTLDRVHSLVAQLDDLDAEIEERRVELADAEAAAAECRAPEPPLSPAADGVVAACASAGAPAPAAYEPSLLDVLLQVIFAQYDSDPRCEGDDDAPPPPAVVTDGAVNFFDRYHAIHLRKIELRRMWQSTFAGRLPKASAMVMKHVASALVAAGPSRLLPGKDQKTGRPKMKVPMPLPRFMPPGSAGGAAGAGAAGAGAAETTPSSNTSSASRKEERDQLSAQLAKSLGL